jgi:hypothetical protein
MQFPSKPETELYNLLPPGEYNFYVKDALETFSKSSGNDMIKVTLVVIDAQGKEHTVIDYLLESQLYKIKHICDTTGLKDAYQEGNLTPELLIGKVGVAKIIIDEPEEDSPFRPKNVVKDYSKFPPKSSDPQKQDEFINDDIKF